MTVERLEQYRFLRHELEELRAQTRDMPGVDCAHIGVVAYADAELTRLQRVREIAAELAAIEAFIGCIKDSQMRLIIQYRFVGGESWSVVAKHIGGRNSRDGVRMMFNRFFKRK